MTLILIAEDDAAIQDVLQTVLSEEGYATVAVANGREALAAIGEHPPDLVLTDLMMPFVSGRELAHALQQHPHWRIIPIIVLTAVPAAARAELPPAVTVLPKPFMLDDLLEAVRMRLGQPRRA